MAELSRLYPTAMMLRRRRDLQKELKYLRFARRRFLNQGSGFVGDLEEAAWGLDANSDGLKPSNSKAVRLADTEMQGLSLKRAADGNKDTI